MSLELEKLRQETEQLKNQIRVSRRTDEPPHDKTNKNDCAPSNDSDQPGLRPSLISLRCPHEESLQSFHLFSILGSFKLPAPKIWKYNRKFQEVPFCDVILSKLINMYFTLIGFFLDNFNRLFISLLWLWLSWVSLWLWLSWAFCFN